MSDPGAFSGLRPFDPRLLERAAAVRWVYVADVVAGVVSTLLLLVQITLIASIIAGATTGQLAAVAGRDIALLALVVAARAGLEVVVERSGRRAASHLMSVLRNQLVTQRLRPGGFDGAAPTDPSALATAAVQGVDGLEVYFSQYLPQVVLAVVVPAAVIVWTGLIDRESALIMVVTLPLIPVFMVLIGRSAAARARSNWTALVALSTHFLDVVQGLATLRAFNRSRAEVPRIVETTDRYRQTTMSTLRLAFLSGLVLDLAATLATAFVAVTLGIRLVDGDVALQPALTVLLLVPELYLPIRAVGTLFHASTDGLAAAEQILELVPAPTPGAGVEPGAAVAAVGSVASVGELPDPRADPVVMRQITVEHPGRAGVTLDGVDLALAPGEVVAITGESGEGKTTLGRVLLGLLRPTSGEVVVGPHPLTDADLDRWRRRVGWAPQRPSILRATVAENIALGDPTADRARIEDAARRAGADGFVTELPDGYETIVGNGGRGLSAGQRQRLGLARALLRDPALLVLDEPTAHLDAAAGTTVAATVGALAGTTTVVVLTHDPALAAVADRVLHLDGGRLTPADLDLDQAAR